MKRLSLFFALVLLGGCSAIVPDPHEPLLPTQVTLIPDAPPQEQPVGSLWQDRGSDLFTDVKARRIGDILTVAIFEKASASKEATTETDRSSSVSADITRFIGYETKFLPRNADPASLIDASFANDFKGSGSTSRKEDLIATLTTQVVEVLPNGNLRIEGKKSVTVNHETQFIVLTGLVRPSDVTAANIVDSKYILDSRISYTGKGVVSDKQKPGWMVRIIDNVWPF